MLNVKMQSMPINLLAQKGDESGKSYIAQAKNDV